MPELPPAPIATTAAPAAATPATPSRIPSAPAQPAPRVSPTPRATATPAAARPATPLSKPVAPVASVASPAAPQPASALSTAESWKQLFIAWPEGVPKRGVVVNQLNEQLPFKSFMTKGDTVLLERTNPDTLGSRFIFVPYCEIGLVKLIDPIKQETFEKAGFDGKLSS